ncbi:MULTISPECIES: peptide deformylase [Robiginitalea]|uniref:peptide deformylase n=2 Tax=Flavobacteriaceae TaxID=49546 RepID=UPI00234AF3AF|nr:MULTISPECIES: peptide deformylase [unclassified Robiginitalea]MDC6355235.1 peptide deformylase [Robiginitalea sp. PM2]MDC6375550.1 peptide deformylase [Robiginitalea sp. SP8]
MILPIVAYGDPVLRRKCETIGPEYPELATLIENMWETMYQANGVGLAAPQVGRPIRLFLVDTSPFAEDEDFSPEEQEKLRAFKRVFINAQMQEETGKKWAFNEGCLSIPDIREDVTRQDTITLRYQDAEFKEHTETFDGLLARVIQHEYDHIEGILFTDHISSLKKRLLKGKLTNISKGKVQIDYKMRFPAVKRGR